MERLDLVYDVKKRSSNLSPLASMSRNPAQILIVDDDVDSALLIESVFAHLGCRTSCSLSYEEAMKKIYTHKADIIILDWLLDHHLDAGNVVNQCTKTFSKFARNKGLGFHERMKVVTYSSLGVSEIDSLGNSYFEHIDHWQKPISHRELLGRALSLLGNYKR